MNNKIKYGEPYCDNELKIEKIYKVIAIISECVRFPSNVMPVMIWDVLDYNDKNYNCHLMNEWLAIKILDIRKHKRQPIEEQTEECIDFIYWLIN